MDSKLKSFLKGEQGGFEDDLALIGTDKHLKEFLLGRMSVIDYILEKFDNE